MRPPADLNRFYRRGELARRLAIFYAASNIASAFGGLLAYGVFQIQGGAIASWRYLFVIEGGATMLFATFAFWYLPKSAAEAKFLTPEEKELAFYRMQIDSSSVVNEKLDWKRALAIFKQPTSWVILVIEMCLGVPLQSVTLFLPQIIARLVRFNLQLIFSLKALTICDRAIRQSRPTCILSHLTSQAPSCSLCSASPATTHDCDFPL